MSPVVHAQLDPTHVRAQAALHTERRRAWLVPAGILGGVAVAIFALVMGLNPAISITGIALVALFYAAMIACAIAVDDPESRNLAFAWLMGGMSAASTLLLLFLLLVEQVS
jgi:hypothetical protein